MPAVTARTMSLRIIDLIYLACRSFVFTGFRGISGIPSVGPRFLGRGGNGLGALFTTRIVVGPI